MDLKIHVFELLSHDTSIRYAYILRYVYVTECTCPDLKYI